MSERGESALLALGALLLFFVLMFGGRSGGPSAAEPARPTSIESAGNGYSIARGWLEAEGVGVRSLRERFAALESLAPGAAEGSGASLLVLTLPGASPIQTQELAALERWLRAGNTLLVMAALADAPDWSEASAGAPVYDLKAVTGLDFESVAERRRRLATAVRVKPAQPGPAAQPDAVQPGADPQAMAEPDVPVTRRDRALLARPQRLAAQPLGSPPLLQGVGSLVAESDYRPAAWTVRLPYDGLVLEYARDRASGEGVLWRRALGRGEIIVSAWGTPFTNRGIGLGDNARLFANLVAHAVGPRGVVVFDDGHQGLSPTYDPAQLFGDRRLHVTIGMLLALWALWVLGATRLRTPRASVPAPRPADLLRAAGGFYARVLATAPAARRLCDNFFARLPRRAGAAALASTAPPWDWLESNPRLAPTDVRQLRDWYDAALAGRRVPLGNLHNLLLRLERQMT